MVVEAVFGTLFVTLALLVGVGGPLLAVHFQLREVHERTLVAETEVVATFGETVDRYREVTDLEPSQIGGLPLPG